MTTFLKQVGLIIFVQMLLSKVMLGNEDYAIEQKVTFEMQDTNLCIDIKVYNKSYDKLYVYNGSWTYNYGLPKYSYSLRSYSKSSLFNIIAIYPDNVKGVNYFFHTLFYPEIKYLPQFIYLNANDSIHFKIYMPPDEFDEYFGEYDVGLRFRLTIFYVNYRILMDISNYFDEGIDIENYILWQTKYLYEDVYLGFLNEKERRSEEINMTTLAMTGDHDYDLKDKIRENSIEFHAVLSKKHYLKLRKNE